MMQLVQISDTHFGTERPEVIAALTATIHQLQPDVILLCGDITQRGRRDEFASARRFMDALPQQAQRIAIPGNHDIPLFNLWVRALMPYANFERAFGHRESLWSRDGVAILALNATHPKRHKNGELPSAHLRERLAAARVACGASGLLVFAAHQPLWTAWPEDHEQTLIGRHESAQLLAEARADIVLSGHVHVPLITTSETSDPHLPWRFVLSGSGTAVSNRTRPGAPNSFHVIETGDPGAGAMTLVRHDFLGSGFEPVATHALRRGPQGWSEGAALPASQRQTLSQEG